MILESVNQLIVADKMFEMLDSETATHIEVCSKGKNGTNPGTWANNVIYFMLPVKSTMNLRELNGMIVKVLMAVGVNSHLGEKSDNFLLGKNFDKGQFLVEDVLLPPEVLDMLGGAQSEENSLAQSSRDLRVDSGNVDETEVSSGILPESTGAHW
ncbi:hypothetical protein TNCV_1051751 [Trichonephila clavipes]|nr:hypothetical protein TNCV_1051751 [Trichonephila clavipes]